MTSPVLKTSDLKKPEYFVLPQSKFLESLNKQFKEQERFEAEKYFEEKVYRKSSGKIECVHTFTKKEGKRVKTVYYDYFNDKKIKSVDEYSEKTGKKIRTTDFTLYKSVTEYNPENEKKLKTVNYTLKDESKIASIHEYHNIYNKVSRISIFRPDGKTISMVKEINPLTERVEKCINYKKDSNIISSISKYEFQNDKMIKTTCYYTDYTHSIKEFKAPYEEPACRTKNAKLIDNLFKKNLNFTMLQI